MWWYVFTNTHSRREKDSDVNSYPPSAINEKVGYAQYGNGGGGGGIRGYRPSGNYEKKITSEPRNDFKTDSRYDTSKRDPILWSGYGSNPSSNPSRFVLKFRLYS